MAETGILELVGPAGVVEEVRRRQGDVDVAGLPDGLAVVERLEHGELPRALLQEAGDPVEVLRPLAAGHLAPRPVEGGAGSADGTVDISGARFAHLAERLLGGGVERREESPLGAVHELAADEQAVGRGDPHDLTRLGRCGVLEGRH